MEVVAALLREVALSGTNPMRAEDLSAEDARGEGVVYLARVIARVGKGAKLLAAWEGSALASPLRSKHLLVWAHPIIPCLLLRHKVAVILGLTAMITSYVVS